MSKVKPATEQVIRRLLFERFSRSATQIIGNPTVNQTNHPQQSVELETKTIVAHPSAKRRLLNRLQQMGAKRSAILNRGKGGKN
jgi:hypothetical protein